MCHTLKRNDGCVLMIYFIFFKLFYLGFLLDTLLCLKHIQYIKVLYHSTGLCLCDPPVSSARHISYLSWGVFFSWSSFWITQHNLGGAPIQLPSPHVGIWLQIFSSPPQMISLHVCFTIITLNEQLKMYIHYPFKIFTIMCLLSLKGEKMLLIMMCQWW